jgi:hypothetical protein
MHLSIPFLVRDVVVKLISKLLEPVMGIRTAQTATKQLNKGNNKMDISNVMAYAGMALDSNEHIDNKTIQKFILEREEVAHPIAIEEIDLALDLLHFGGFLEIYKKNFEGCFYQRRIPRNRNK